MLIISIGILGNSQTFVGTHAAVFILCILSSNHSKSSNKLETSNIESDEPNIIIRAVKCFEKIKSGRCKNVPKYINKLKSKKEVVSFFKLIETIYENETPQNSDNNTSDKTNNDSCLKKAMDLSDEFSSECISFQTDILKQGTSIKIFASPELTDAPLYSFLYALSLFIFDEISIRWHEQLDYCISILCVFTIMSFLFGLIKWVAFFLHNYRLNTSKNPYINAKFQHVVNKAADFFSTPNSLLSFLLHFLSIALLGIIAISILVFCSEWTSTQKNLLFWGLTLLIPMIVFGIIHEVNTAPNYSIQSKTDKDRKPTVLLGHFVMFLVYSFIITTLFLFCCNNLSCMNGMTFNYTNVIQITHFAIAFILINGIIFPILLSYILIKAILHTKFSTKTIDALAQPRFKPIIDKINTFLYEINHIQ